LFSFEVSPMTQVMTGISFAKKLHVPHYLYVQDLWPENVITVTGIRNPLIIKPIDKMVDYIYKNSDEIFATSPSFVEAICNRKVAVNREKVHYWPQYAEEFYKPIDKSIAKEAAAAYGIPNDDSFKIIFTGNVGTAQGIDILPQTAELLKNENIKFVIIGDGRYLEKLVSDIKSRQLEKMFIFVARQPAEKIPVLLSACDVAFISFADDELWKMTIPAKLQSYMACGMPIIAVADGETKRIIEEAKCGWVCKMGDSRGLKKTIHEVMKIDLQEMMKHSLCYYNNNYKKEKVISKIMDYLD
jgi:glycosyltransferase involved in cell wall biosynthesis